MPCWKPGIRTRLWCFSQFNLDWDYQAMIDKGQARYIAYGPEICPKTKRPHHQGFIYFKCATASIKNVAKILGKCHVEGCKGTLLQNEDYCSKATMGVLVEFGEPPKQGARMDIADMMDGVKKGVPELTLAEENPALWCQYGRRLEKYRKLLQPIRTWKTEVWCFWGIPESGKTTKAWEMGGPEMDSCSFHNGFLVGYTNAEAVLFDDFNWGDIRRDVFLKLMDYGKFTVNVKGSEVTWNPRRVFITSNYSPYEWGFDTTTNAAILRRLDNIEHFQYKWDDPRASK